jgi:hypothetical protein
LATNRLFPIDDFSGKSTLRKKTSKLIVMGNSLANSASKYITMKFAFIIEASYNARVVTEIYSSNLLLLLEGVKEKVLNFSQLCPEKYEYMVESNGKKERVVYLYHLIKADENEMVSLSEEKCFLINDRTKRVCVKLKSRDANATYDDAVITVELVDCN